MTDFSELLGLASLLSSERGATVQEILSSEEFGYTSRSSIYADFMNISKHFHMDVEATEERRGDTGREVVQRISREEWDRFRSRFIQKVLGKNDRLLLSFMLESVGSLSPLISAAGNGFLSKLQNLVGDMAVRPTGAKGYFALESIRNLAALLEAESEESSLYIRYKGEKRLLWPLKCFMFSGGVYCYVMNEDGAVYMLSVPRIEGIGKELQRTPRTRPVPRIDVDEALSDPFGIVRDDEEFTAIIRLDGWQGLYEKEKAWPDSVSIEQDGESFLFTVRTCGRYWLKRWVLSLGPDAEVLEPESLRKEIAEDIRKMLVLYS